MGLANPDLQWQKTQDNNIGVDITLMMLWMLPLIVISKKRRIC